MSAHGSVNRDNPFPIERGELFTPTELQRLQAKTEDLANSVRLQDKMKRNPEFCASTHRLWQCRWFSAEHGFNIQPRQAWVEPLSEVIRKLEARGYPARKRGDT